MGQMGELQQYQRKNVYGNLASLKGEYHNPKSTQQQKMSNLSL